MAILRMHSFDVPDFQYTGLGNTNPAFDTTYARTGARSWTCGGGAFNSPGTILMRTGGSDTSVWIQFAQYRTGGMNAFGNTGGPLVAFCSGGTQNVQIDINSDWGFTAYRMTGDWILTAIGSSDPGLLSTGAWNFMEFSFTLHASAGIVNVKLNGIEHLNLTGIRTTGYFSSGVIDYMMMGQQAQNNSGDRYAWFDDLIIGNDQGSSNTTPPGDCRVEYLVPIGAGSKTEFTPSTGSNWSNVDELGPPSDADYNYSPETGATDLFAMSNMSGNGLVYGIRTVVRARKDDAGYRKIRPAFYKSDGVGNTPRLYGGLDQAVTDSFAYTNQVFETSPDTGVAWTVDEIADLQYGYSVGGGSQFGVDAWVAAF